jgi:hypothetical protein
MALMAPQTTTADVDRHHEIFDEALQELRASVAADPRPPGAGVSR